MLLAMLYAVRAKSPSSHIRGSCREYVHAKFDRTISIPKKAVHLQLSRLTCTFAEDSQRPAWPAQSDLFRRRLSPSLQWKRYRPGSTLIAIMTSALHLDLFATDTLEPTESQSIFQGSQNGGAFVSGRWARGCGLSARKHTEGSSSQLNSQYPILHSCRPPIYRCEL
ncbi:hypothetical protein EDC01DRAFT_362771 [Geopyxis carbonaria]|nr:hypothetical protein EDC01DRAFT_362771 [Geopyxis carbonaria]